MKSSNVFSYVKGSMGANKILAVTINGKLPITHITELMRCPEVTVSPVYSDEYVLGSNNTVSADCPTIFGEKRCQSLAFELAGHTQRCLNNMLSLREKPSEYYRHHIASGAAWVFFTATSTQWATVIQRLKNHPWSEMRWVASSVSDTLCAKEVDTLDEDVWHCPYIFAEDLDHIFDFTKNALLKSGISAITEKFIAERCFDTMMRVSIMRVIKPLVFRSYLEHSEEAIAVDIAEFNALQETDSFISTDAMCHQLFPDKIEKGAWLNSHLHGNTPGMCQYAHVYAWDSWRKRAVCSPAA